MYAVAAEGLVFSSIILILLRWVAKLHNHVRSEHFEYYEENLASSLYAGDQTVFNKQLRSLKNIYFGEMPDELSRYYQKRLRRLAIMALAALGSGVITFLVALVVVL